jgi:hypothetical protein
MAQLCDWLAHRAVGPAAPPRALVAVCAFTLISALFHLHVMRRGVFLTGVAGRTLADDFRRIPGLLLEIAAALPQRWARVTASEPALQGVSTYRSSPRYAGKSDQTRRRTTAVAGPPPRTTTTYGPIFTVTRRAGADFPDFGVGRR